MRALAGAGRQTEALALYEQTRDRLADELGVDPSPLLRDAHLAVLRGEAAVAAPVPPSPGRGRLSRRGVGRKPGWPGTSGRRSPASWDARRRSPGSRHC